MVSVADYLPHPEKSGFSGAVLVGDRESVIFGAGVGAAKRDPVTQNTVDTVFDAGSVAKVFPAAEVLAAVEEGQLRYGATLGELLVGVPADRRGITIWHLLNHRSGLGQYHGAGGDFTPMTRAQALAAILDQELLFEPGAGSAYSNSGYTLLALVLEQVLERTFEEVVTDMFDRAAMSQTGSYGSMRLADDEVAVGAATVLRIHADGGVAGGSSVAVR